MSELDRKEADEIESVHLDFHFDIQGSLIESLVSAQLWYKKGKVNLGGRQCP